MDLTIDETPTRLKLTSDAVTIRVLREHFRFRPPDYWRSPAYVRYKATLRRPEGPTGWDGYTQLIEYNGAHCSMLRGHKEELLRVCADHGITVRGTYLTSPFVGLTVDDVPARVIKADFELDHNQRTCVVNLLRTGTGVIKVTVSGGKTAIFAAVAAMIKSRVPSARALYVTPTERLVNQVREEMIKFLPGWHITQAGGGKKDTTGRDMVVATMATLSRNAATLHAEGFFKSFIVLLVDEVHHAGTAETWQTVCRLVPALFRYGASDTVKDEQDKDEGAMYNIRGLFGPVRAEIDVSPLIATGRIARPHLHLVDVEEWEGKHDELPHIAELNTPAWCLVDGAWVKGTYLGGAVDEEVVDKHGNALELKGLHSIDLPERGPTDVESRWCLLRRAYDVAVINNKERNGLIVQWAAYYAGKGWPTLIVATRTLHVLILEELCKRAGLDVVTLTGEDDTRERDRIFKWLMAKPGRVLISPLVKEGVSLPELRAGIVADVVANLDLARQIIGRFIRKKPTGDNECHITWFIDRQYKSARKNCLALFRALEKIRGFTYYWPAYRPADPTPKYEQVSFD